MTKFDENVEIDEITSVGVALVMTFKVANILTLTLPPTWVSFEHVFETETGFNLRIVLF